MNKAIIAAILAIFLIPLAMATQTETQEVTVNIEEPQTIGLAEPDQTFSELIKKYIVDPKNNTCYVYTDRPVMVNDYKTGAPINIVDVTDYKTYSFYKVHDQWTLIDMVKKNCYTTHLENIEGKNIIVFEDEGKCAKSEAQIYAEKMSIPIQACLETLPKLRAYHKNSKAPQGSTFWVKILGLQSKTYSRGEQISLGWDAGTAITTLKFDGLWHCAGAEGCPEKGYMSITEDWAVNTQFENTPEGLNNWLITNLGVDLGVLKGQVYTLDLSTLPDPIYQILAGEKYTVTLEGQDKEGNKVTDSVDIEFENPT